jgi:cytoskeletal protein CcmA (bactofilin family)
MKHKKLTIASAFLLAALTAQVQAAFPDWLGGTSNDWSDNSNWEGGNGVDAADTAEIYHSLTSSVPTPHNTVLKSGDSATLTRVWLGRQGDEHVGLDGNLTVESTASLSTTADFIISQESSLTSSGAISVGNGDGLRVTDSGTVTLKSGSTLNKMTLRENSTATLESGSTLNNLTLQGNSFATLETGSTVDTIVNPSQFSQLTLNSTYSSNLTMRESSTLTLNGTLDGNLEVQGSASLTVNGTLNGDINNTSSSMLTIGASGTVNGLLEVNSNEQVTVAGNVNGLFKVNGTGQVIIESTANILSDSNGDQFATSITNNCSIQWNVGVDGSIGTLRSNANESSLDAYDGTWIYHVTDNSMVVDLSAYVPDGDPISLQPFSGLQFADREAGFVSNLEFIRNGEDISGDFTYEGDGTFSATILPDSYSTDTDSDGLMDNVETILGPSWMLQIRGPIQTIPTQMMTA